MEYVLAYVLVHPVVVVEVHPVVVAGTHPVVVVDVLALAVARFLP